MHNESVSGTILLNSQWSWLWLFTHHTKVNHTIRFLLIMEIFGKLSTKVYKVSIISFFNDTHRERLVFHSVQYRNGWLAASDLFDMFTQSIKFLYIPLSVQMFEKCDSSNRQYNWMVASFSKFYGKIWVSFCVNTEKRFFLEVLFWSQQKEHRFF